jgi:hypothetical protein
MRDAHPGPIAEFLELQGENFANLYRAISRWRQARREAKQKPVQPAAVVPAQVPAVLEPAPIALVAVDPPAGDNVVDWIREYRARHGRNPQIKEVQRQFVLSKSTAHRRIQAS